tara:strand:- start:209 stop:532 length:324 start_codon:yes stop_codon:yes gene_type:complete
MNNILDDMDKLKTDIYSCLEDLEQINDPVYNKMIFQDIIIKGLFSHFKDLTKNIDNLNKTIMVLSRHLKKELEDNKYKNDKIELLQFKYIESKIKIKELKKKIKSMN